MSRKTEFWEVLESRRSVRKFEDRPLARRQVEHLLVAGIMAPNAHNRQSWRFAVLDKPATIAQLADAMGENLRPVLLAEGLTEQEADERLASRKGRICGAPLAVLLFVDINELNTYADEDRNQGEYIAAVQSATLAGGQMLLAAQALGLGGLWVGAPLYAPKAVRQTLDLPDSWMAQGLLLFGYPAEKPGPRERKPLADVVVWR